MTCHSLKALNPLHMHRGVTFLRRPSWRSLQHDNSPHLHHLSHKLVLPSFFCKHLPKEILHPKQQRHNRSLQTLQEGAWVKGHQAMSADSLPLVGVHQPRLFYTFSLLLTNRQQKKQCPKRGEPNSSVWGTAGTSHCCQASQNAPLTNSII